MAILLLERRAGLAEFTDEVVNRPDVQEMIGRVEFEADPGADAGGYREMTSLIEVELVDGTVLRTRAEFGKGSPANPMRDDELIDKFLACLDWAGIPGDTGRAVAERVIGLGSADDDAGRAAPAARCGRRHGGVMALDLDVINARIVLPESGVVAGTLIVRDGRVARDRPGRGSDWGG